MDARHTTSNNNDAQHHRWATLLSSLSLYQSDTFFGTPNFHTSVFPQDLPDWVTSSRTYKRSGREPSHQIDVNFKRTLHSPYLRIRTLKASLTSKLPSYDDSCSTSHFHFRKRTSDLQKSSWAALLSSKITMPHSLFRLISVTTFMLFFKTDKENYFLYHSTSLTPTSKSFTAFKHCLQLQSPRPYSSYIYIII